MTSDAPTNAGKAMHKRFSLLVGPNDIVLYDVTQILAFRQT